MNPRFKIIAAVASLVVVTILFRCFFLWQPQRQLILHQAHLRAAVEARNWSRLGAFLDPAYADRWGYTRETGLRDARQWLGQYFGLTITAQDQDYRLTPDGGIVTEQWKIDGTGTEVTGMITERVNALHAPFTFQWKHGSWKPWDWTLVRVDNPDLQISPTGELQ